MTSICKACESPTIIIPRQPEENGLAELDIERFWLDQELSRQNPFGKIPQLPLSMQMSQECVFDELGIPEDWWRLTHDDEYRIAVCKAYNDKAEKIVGRRLVNETPRTPEREYPQVKALHDIFEGENVWHNESYWLQQSAHNEDELAALLDRVEARLDNLREFVLPENWEDEKARLTAQGVKPSLYRGQRGPITFACSIFGTENLIFLLNDDEELAGRFRDLILRSILELAQIRDEEAGYTPETAPRGWYWCDDNCALMNRDMYEFFGYPILKGVFERYCPGENDMRGQHSDSEMAHLLPLLGKLNLTTVNFGPTVLVPQVREHLPKAVINGVLAPFTLSRDKTDDVISELHRDFRHSCEHGRGVVWATAGSINNGSRLRTMRLIMSEIQKHCRY